LERWRALCCQIQAALGEILQDCKFQNDSFCLLRNAIKNSFIFVAKAKKTWSFWIWNVRKKVVKETIYKGKGVNNYLENIVVVGFEASYNKSSICFVLWDSDDEIWEVQIERFFVGEKVKKIVKNTCAMKDEFDGLIWSHRITKWVRLGLFHRVINCNRSKETNPKW